MRLATYEQNGSERFGLVLRHPIDGADWIFDPNAVEAAARALPSLKGAGFTWWRAPFSLGQAWPADLVEFLRLGPAGMTAARHLHDFLARYLEQSDPLVFAQAGAPLAQVQLLAPIPEPRLLLGVVGNNPGFLRMDPARGRNLQQPKCHQRTQTSVIGPGQPFVLPAGGTQFAGTTELGVIIGRGGRDIAREQAREHIAGYTIVNDALGSLFAHRWAELDAAAGHHGTHYHSANTASWLDKKADTMLAMGPWLVTPDEVGDPYDLLCHYREGGVSRNRAHSGALCTGIEELIHWLSQFLTLEPGMVLHLGAMGQDGLTAGSAERFGPDYFVECEIERLGVLRNPLVVPSHRDWRAPDDPGRTVHPSPLVRKLISTRRTDLARASDWTPESARHFWTLLGNSRIAAGTDAVPPRPYPLAYNAPATALAPDGAEVILPPRAHTITGACEFGLVIRSLTRDVSPALAPQHILGFIVLAVLRDSSFHNELIQPHVLQAGIPEIYSRWLDGTNVVSAPPVPLEKLIARRTTFAIDGVGEIAGSTDAYVLDAATTVSELSRGITLLPGDVIAFGPSGPGLVVPPSHQLPSNTQLTASIEGIGHITAKLIDRRKFAASDKCPQQS
jgi:2-keto-4-pentenoate hydratase/2-oxohepta-3-ene-1,7-dioic acid hydratase in catechol pathway